MQTVIDNQPQGCSTLTQQKFHRHEFFGTQLLSVESCLALEEGLITESDFNEVRSTFLRAQKLRAYYDFGSFSQDEFVSRKDEFATEILSLPDLGGRKLLDIALQNHELLLVRKSEEIKDVEQEESADTVMEISSTTNRTSDNEADVEEKTHSRGNSNGTDEGVPDVLVPAQQVPPIKLNISADTPFGTEQAVSWNSMQQQSDQINMKSVKDQETKISKNFMPEDEERGDVKDPKIPPVKYNIISNMDESGKNVVNEQSSEPSPINEQLKSSENIINFVSIRNNLPKQVSKLQWDHHDDEEFGDPEEEGHSEEQNLVEDKDLGDAEVEGDYDSVAFESASEGTPSVARETHHAQKKGVKKSESPEGSTSGGNGGKVGSPRSAVSSSAKTTTSTTASSMLTSKNIAAINSKTASGDLNNKPVIPANVPDYGAGRMLQKKSSNFTGMEITEAALNLYQHMRIEHEYKWVTFEINPTKKIISISNSGDSQSSYQSFVEAFSPVRCCYAVVLFQIYKRGERQHKPVFVNWCPDDAPVRQRMMYASNKDFFKQFLDGLALEIQATDEDDLKEADLKDQVIRQTK